jgi:hypothetical protein
MPLVTGPRPHASWSSPRGSCLRIGPLDVNGQPALRIGIGVGLGAITLALGIVSPEQLLLLGFGAGAASQRECRRGREHDAEHDEIPPCAGLKLHSCTAEFGPLLTVQ